MKEDAKKSQLSEEQSDNLSAVFRTQMPKIDKAEFMVQVDALGEEAVISSPPEFFAEQSGKAERGGWGSEHPFETASLR